jgi:hypothetical protein
LAINVISHRDRRCHPAFAGGRNAGSDGEAAASQQGAAGSWAD